MKATWPETPIDGRSFRRLEPLAIYDQLDYEPRAAIEARDEALARVEERSAPWRAVAYDVLCQLARKLDTLTSDDLMEELDRRGIPRPVEGRAAGPVMQKGIREGVLVPIGYTQGRDRRHHADVARLYRSGLR